MWTEEEADPFRHARLSDGCSDTLGYVNQVDLAARLSLDLDEHSLIYWLPFTVGFPHLCEEITEFATAAWMSKFAQGLGFDLPDALPGHIESLPYLLQRMRTPIF